MSYKTINASANDLDVARQASSPAAAQEGAQYPDAAAAAVLWPVCTASDVEAAYASTLAADNPDPGGDEGVVTDGMILANVQPNLPETP